ncbi:MAG TPA: hypothetical protein VM778_14810, partial [Gemmatimonadota bacterium]|nr:hypothetical protein [Gemmatimonadota bacterium]
RDAPFVVAHGAETTLMKKASRAFHGALRRHHLAFAARSDRTSTPEPEHTALGGIVAFLEELAGMTPEEYAQWEARFAPAPGDTAAVSSGHSHAPGAPAHSH